MVEPSIWKPRVTVAAVCERDGDFLVVSEAINGQQLFNQPAGHLEVGESLEQAVIREVLEETAYNFRPQALVGIYRYQPDTKHEQTFLRFTFCGEIIDHHPDRVLDQDIIAVQWMSFEALQACRERHRSPLVLQCILDYQQNPAYPLQVFSRQFS